MSQKIDGYTLNEYYSGSHPLTSYPQLLASHLANRFNLNENTELLEIGIGPGEVLLELASLGIRCSCIDQDQDALNRLSEKCRTRNLHIKMVLADAETSLSMPNCSFDIVYTKSFLEHLSNPVSFLKETRRVLKPNGRIINLIPDWESQKDTFFDDITHITPFSVVTARQVLKLAGFQNIECEKFRQLPICWTRPMLNRLANCVAPFVRPRTKNKTLRWTRELMILATAEVN